MLLWLKLLNPGVVAAVVRPLGASAIVADLSDGISISAAVAIAAAIVLVCAALLARFLYRLRGQAQLFSELFEQLPQAAALTTLDHRIIRVNAKFSGVFGYAPAAAIGHQIGELIVPAESQDEYRGHLESLARGERVEAEGIRRRQDGEHFPAAIAMAPFSLPGQEAAVCAVFRDVTESRREEETRSANERRWRAAFDNSAVGIALADTHGKFAAANRAYQEMMGYTEDELRALTFMDLTCEEDRPVSAALAADLFAGKLPRFQLEKRMRRKDGRSIWVRITVSTIPGVGYAPPIGLGIVEDITERKLAETTLREYEEVVEGVQEMIVVVDRDYRYLIANQAFLNYHGLKREQVVGHAVSELVGQTRFEEITKGKLDECLQHGRAVKCELQFDFPSLGRRDLFGSYFPIEGPAGVDRVAVVLADVTARKQAERELQRSFAELHALTAQLHSVREEERTKLARELHDQLGQALTAIRIDLAGLKTMPTQERQVQRIDAIVGLVDETIRSVRRITTELRPGILDDLGLVAAVEWAAEDFQTRTGIQCRASLPETNPGIDAERATALFRIVQETLTNIARHAGATQASIRLSEESGHLSLEVRDNGRGIAAEQLSASGSLGILGMRERALLMGGEFFIGNPGGGTTVRVRIPIDRRKAAANS